jgi:hypothetical protein
MGNTIRACAIGAALLLAAFHAPARTLFTPPRESPYCSLWKDSSRLTFDVRARPIDAETHFVPEIEALKAQLRSRLDASGIQVVEGVASWRFALPAAEGTPAHGACVGAAPHLELDHSLLLLSPGPPAQWQVIGRLRVFEPSRPVHAASICVAAVTFERPIRGLRTSANATSQVDLAGLEEEALAEFICHWKLARSGQRCDDSCMPIKGR